MGFPELTCPIFKWFKVEVTESTIVLKLALGKKVSLISIRNQVKLKAFLTLFIAVVIRERSGSGKDTSGI